MPEGTKVIVNTDLTLSGAVAQYGRGVGIIQATANQIIQQFATCLKSELSTRRRVGIRRCNAIGRCDDLNRERGGNGWRTGGAAASRISAASGGKTDLRLFIDVERASESIKNLFRGKNQ